jgi:hypothetical protein
MTPDAPRPLGPLVRNAVLVRVALAVVLHFGVSEYLFAPDQMAYHSFSLWLARYWDGDTLVYPPRLRAGGPTGYYHVVAALYYLLGGLSLLPKLMNAVLGGLSVPLVYDMARRVTGSEAASFRAASYVAYFPSLVLWSTLNIRDVWVIFLILLICRQALVIQARFGLLDAALLGAALLGVTQFRDYIFTAVAGPMLVSFLFRTRKNLGRNVLVGMAAAALVIYANRAIGPQSQLSSLDLAEIQSLRQWHGVGAASRFEMADISTPGKALAFLPTGLAYFLLAPFPWAVSGIRQVLTLPEMLFFYSLLPAILRGVRVLLRERLSESLMVLLIAAGLTLGYALGEGNAGTAYRHRAQVITFYLVFAAVGVEVRRRAADAPLARPVPA